MVNGGVVVILWVHIIKCAAAVHIVLCIWSVHGRCTECVRARAFYFIGKILCCAYDFRDSTGDFVLSPSYVESLDGGELRMEMARSMARKAAQSNRVPHTSNIHTRTTNNSYQYRHASSSSTTDNNLTHPPPDT